MALQFIDGANAQRLMIKTSTEVPVTITPILAAKVKDHMDSFLYRPMRPFSRALANKLANCSISPDMITFLWFTCYLGAAFCFSAGQISLSIVASCLILAAAFLDCLDGDLARQKSSESLSGAFLEQVFHWIAQSILISGIVFGYQAEISTFLNPLIFLAIALVIDQMFHQIFFIIEKAMNPDKSYGMLHGLTASLYPLMPVNMNLFWITGLFGVPHFGLIINTLVSGAILFSVANLYYWFEKW